MEIRHPGVYIQQELTKRGRTQKDFARILGKKISEVNELIKGKRNITVHWDILLSALFDDPEKKWLHIQMEYDYVSAKSSFDEERLSDIVTRKNNQHLHKEVHHQNMSKKNSVASHQESSTILDTNKISHTDKEKQFPVKPPQELTEEKNQRKKGQEIFRNF